jgi:hypothetical protein
VEFRIADTFTDSLARLTGDEQKAIKTTAFDLQVNVADEERLGYGVPAEWLSDVRRATEDTVLAPADHLPPEFLDDLRG